MGILAYRWLGHWRVWKQNEIRVKTVIYIEQIYTYAYALAYVHAANWFWWNGQYYWEKVSAHLIGLDNGLVPNRRQVIIWTNDQWDMEV